MSMNENLEFEFAVQLKISPPKGINIPPKKLWTMFFAKNWKEAADLALKTFREKYPNRIVELA